MKQISSPPPVNENRGNRRRRERPPPESYRFTDEEPAPFTTRQKEIVLSRPRERAAAMSGPYLPAPPSVDAMPRHRPFPPAGPALAQDAQSGPAGSGSPVPVARRLVGEARGKGIEKQNPPRLRLRGFTVTGDGDDA